MEPWTYRRGWVSRRRQCPDGLLGIPGLSMAGFHGSKSGLSGSKVIDKAVSLMPQSTREKTFFGSTLSPVIGLPTHWSPSCLHSQSPNKEWMTNNISLSSSVHPSTYLPSIHLPIHPFTLLSNYRQSPRPFLLLLDLTKSVGCLWSPIHGEQRKNEEGTRGKRGSNSNGSNREPSWSFSL